ncbi:hypothetical protein [Ruegeria marina]|uniref:Uncharacterized protein n=1 Tax=Ruegeria marina TaxID=639004 RepID=A0A1G6PI13_9RHOB|nr:hypothetical protein [Ruegeria marina]SDC79631.1 hypothetical protein SAMN04488239_103410 [Ruegeria marina]
MSLPDSLSALLYQTPVPGHFLIPFVSVVYLVVVIGTLNLLSRLRARLVEITAH